jgi:hypothetical protein
MSEFFLSCPPPPELFLSALYYNRNTLFRNLFIQKWLWLCCSWPMEAKPRSAPSQRWH